jgi:hypothetical protein
MRVHVVDKVPTWVWLIVCLIAFGNIASVLNILWPEVARRLVEVQVLRLGFAATVYVLGVFWQSARHFISVSSAVIQVVLVLFCGQSFRSR